MCIRDRNNSVKEIRRLNITFRLVLVPCPNSTGRESDVAKSWESFELITKSNCFWKFHFSN